MQHTIFISSFGATDYLKTSGMTLLTSQPKSTILSNTGAISLHADFTELSEDVCI